jgi:hypothetical protein
MSEKNNKSAADENLRLYERGKNNLLERRLSNAEKFDRAILAYSVVGLGFSLTFLKTSVPGVLLGSLWFLVFSWILFALAIILTIGNYFVSQKAIDTQLLIAEDYDLKDNQKTCDNKNGWAQAASHMNCGMGVCFLLAVICAVLFVSLNLTGEMPLAQKTRQAAASAATPQKTVETPPKAPVSLTPPLVHEIGLPAEIEQKPTLGVKTKPRKAKAPTPAPEVLSPTIIPIQ